MSKYLPKKCPDCNTEINGDKRYTRCASCAQKKRKYKTDAHKNSLRKRSKRHFIIKKVYNLTQDQYYGRLESQEYSCAICKTPQADSKFLLSVDHDRSCCNKDGSCGNCVRGLLCQKCNLALGGFGDSLENLQSAIEYVSKWKRIMK